MNPNYRHLPKDAESDFMTSIEAANFLRISAHRLRNMVSQGTIPYYKLGASNRYRRSELESILNKTKRGASP